MGDHAPVTGRCVRQWLGQRRCAGALRWPHVVAAYRRCKAVRRQYELAPQTYDLSL
jgi:hypothetical protein